MNRIPNWALAALILALTLNPISARDDSAINYTRDIRPILSNNCLHCHGPDAEKREADLRLDRESGIQAAFRDADGDGLERILSDDEDFRMPPKSSHHELKPEEIALIKAWVEKDAPFESHWSFDPPKRPKVPSIPPSHANWARNEIDGFILRKLVKAGLSPNDQADRQRLIRRVTLDLTGLPPTIKEIDDFVNDPSPDAYEKVVDRLLASDAFGERMALNWMDAARYGDTSVFHADGRRDMWAWRDWVIKSYNDNMPFDEFTVRQLAGDLLPNATWRDKVASAFNRNHGTTDEGGVIPEEYRVEYVVDRVKTTSMVWLGLTMECGQCHSHKYDPISQREYYQFFAFFNQTADPGMQTRNGNQAPIIQVPNEANQKKLESVRAELADLTATLTAHRKNSEEKFQMWLAKAAAAKPESAVPNDMAFHWKLDQVNKNRIVDAVKPGRTGTIRGKAATKPGRIGNALELNGSAHVDLGDINGFERDSKFTLSAWIKWNKKDGAIFSRMKNGGDYRGYDVLISGGHIEFHLIHSWPSNALKVRTKNRIKENQWQHICVTYDGSSKAQGVRIFYDGVNQPWDIQQDGLKDTTITNVPFLIGQRTGGSPLKGLLDDLRVYPRDLSELEVKALAGANDLDRLLAIEAGKRTAEQIELLRQHYFQAVDSVARELQSKITGLQKRQSDLAKPLTTVMVMQEMPKPRMTYILERGNYASPKKDEVIQPGTPAFLPPMDDSYPKNRLGLARWLVNGKNPLTARVTVNRYWMMFFGRGIVETAEDFGTQGSSPTHPELLDYLATDFVESGWDIKRILKKIVMSATYRQSSKADPIKLKLDPGNKLLSRGPRFRLMGEFIRDSALFAAGLLSDQVGGPSVKPYQPPGLWNEVSLNGGLRFRRDSGEKLYRKSMYIYWRRSAPMPSMSIFGTPSREKCVIRRSKTNTPLQALVTLNDEQFVEAARFLAQRVMTDSGLETPKAKIVRMYRLMTGVRPTDRALRLLLDSYSQEKDHYAKHPDDAKKLLMIGEKKRDEKLDAAEHAAMTVIASIIMNLDEALTRN